MTDKGTMGTLNIITNVYRAQTIEATLYRIVWLAQEAVLREAAHQEAIKADAQEEVTLVDAQYGVLKAVALAQRATIIGGGMLLNRPLFALVIIKNYNIKVI